MRPKLAGKPAHDEPVGFHILIYGIPELEKTFRSTAYVTLGIQELALMLMLVCTVDPNETVCFALGVGKPDEEST